MKTAQPSTAFDVDQNIAIALQFLDSEERKAYSSQRIKNAVDDMDAITEKGLALAASNVDRLFADSGAQS